MSERMFAVVVDAVVKELSRAMNSHPTFHSPHEGYAIIQEEMDELWEEVTKKEKNHNLKAMRNEAIQIAAMAIRFAIECT